MYLVRHCTASVVDLLSLKSGDAAQGLKNTEKILGARLQMGGISPVFFCILEKALILRKFRGRSVRNL